MVKKSTLENKNRKVYNIRIEKLSKGGIKMDKSALKKRANTLPLTPGVYIMKDKNGKVIYVGKAVALKNRVTQYFGSDLNHSSKVRRMVENVCDFDFILCDTEFEALILENSLIKQYQPKYNILLKDDKGYHYVKITDEKWPKIEAVKLKNKSGKYIGPYNSGTVVKNAVDEALKIFKLPNCNRSFDKPSKPCLNFHIGICSAPCKGKMSTAEYKEAVDSAVTFIKKGGYGEKDIKALREKMNNAAEELNFEYAAKLRDRIEAIERLSLKQKVVSLSHKNQDVFATARVGDIACIQSLKFRNGNLCDQEHFIFEESGNAEDLYSEFLTRYYADNCDIPSTVLIDTVFDGTELLACWLSDIKKAKVTIYTAQKGEQKKLLDMCLSNAAENLSKKIERTGRETSAVNELGQLLGMEKPPRYIEAYDISNTAGDENVASMTVFYDGRPLRSNYRKFKIKGFLGQDDYKSMAEVIDRRMTEYEKQEDAAFSRMPDLILLDGGSGQISAVLPVLSRHNIEVAVFGMVKDSKHKTRAIATTGEDIAIKATRRAYTLVTNIQDETHRFAITYHKHRKSKTMLQSELLKINGVGKKRAEALYKSLKSLKAIKEASVEKLCAVDGINKETAENIYNYFRN